MQLTTLMSNTVTTATTTATTTLTTTTSIESNKRRRTGEGVEEGHLAKKAKMDSHPSILNDEEILAKLKSVTENLGIFASTHPKDQAFIQGQVTQLTQVQQSLTHLFQQIPTYESNKVYLFLIQALEQKNYSDIIQYLHLLITHNDLNQFIEQHLGLTRQKDFFDLSFDAAYQTSSKKVFSALIQAIHQVQPSFLTAPWLIRKMRNIFDTQECSDLKLRIQSQQDISQQEDSPIVTLHVNKGYLGVIAPYFHRMFFGTHSWKETEQSELKLILEELESSHNHPLTHANVYNVLRYCHTHTIFFRGVEECLAILLLAGKWEIQSLIQICDHYLAQSIDPFDLAQDSFEAILEIAKATRCTKLTNRLLNWAISQHLQGGQVDENVLQILDKEKNQVTHLILNFALKKNQLKPISMESPKVESILLTQLFKDTLESITFLLKEFKALTKLKLVRLDVSAKAIEAITSTQLQSLTSLSLINCNFLSTKLNHLHSNAAQLRKFKLTESLTKHSFGFLEQCTHLESLTLHIEKSWGYKPVKESFQRLKNLKKLRVLKLDMDDASLFEACQETLTKWTHLEQLELNSKGVKEFAAGNINCFWENKADIAKIHSIIQKQNFPDLKIFKSNIVQHEMSFLYTVAQLKSVIQLSLTTAIDPRQLSNAEKTFSPMPSLNTLEWNCGGIIAKPTIPRHSKIKHIPVLPFLASLENLENLHLKNAQLDDAILNQLKKFSHLHTLHCEGIKNLDDAYLAHLAQLPWLESLTLTRCDLITDQGLRSLLNSENLQKVIIQDCVHISEQGTTFIKESKTIREFTFFLFQETDWTFERAKHVLDAQPTDTQAMAYLLKAMSIPAGTTIAHFGRLAQQKLKEVIAKEPTKYIHWKNLGFVLHQLAEKPEDIRHAYQQAAALGMDPAEVQKALEEIKVTRQRQIRIFDDLPQGLNLDD